MGNQSRDLRDKVIRGLAKVGLVWALAVLGAVFMTMSAQAQESGAGYSLPAAHTDAHTGTHTGSHSGAFGVSGGAPRTAGIALALLILGGGVTVLAIGAARGDRVPEPTLGAEPEPTVDLSLALGLGLFA